MNCRDFNEILDSYLSGELLVETNHTVIRHLQNCRDCRDLLAVRRSVREHLRRAVAEAEESQMDPAFAVRLRESLNASTSRPSFLGFRLVGAAAAILVIGVLAVYIAHFETDPPNFVDVGSPVPSNQIIAPTGTQVIPAMLRQAANDAFDDHKNCALAHKLKEKPISLEKAARTVDSVNLGLDKATVEALREKFGNDVELIKAHYCLINGRYFSHVVLSYRGRALSVLLTKLSETEDASPAACGTDGDLGSACFSSDGYGIYVVSDSGDDLLVANSIFEPLSRHISKSRLSI